MKREFHGAPWENPQARDRRVADREGVDTLV
jgi:hypothetical protein